MLLCVSHQDEEDGRAKETHRITDQVNLMVATVVSEFVVVTLVRSGPGSVTHLGVLAVRARIYNTRPVHDTFDEHEY